MVFDGSAAVGPRQADHGERPRPVTVAALTYKRPRQLERLLAQLVDQAAELDPPATVLIVDNDPDAGAAAVTGAFADRGVIYLHEPTPGIAAGRNRAMAAAAAESAAIVFIDDDETPQPGWLTQLVATWAREGVAAVGGPVVRDLTDLDPWIRATGLFDPYRFTTGTRVTGGATNNLLLDLAFVRDVGLRFDARFGLTGGSDTLLLQTLLRRGGEIAWCNEARVLDDVPAERLTKAWVRTRYFRTGNTSARVQLTLAGEPRRERLCGAARSLARLARGALVWTAGTVTRRLAWRARGAVRVYSECGFLWACAGREYVEYRRLPARSRSRSTLPS